MYIVKLFANGGNNAPAEYRLARVDYARFDPNTVLRGTTADGKDITIFPGSRSMVVEQE